MHYLRTDMLSFTYSNFICVYARVDKDPSIQPNQDGKISQ